MTNQQPLRAGVAASAPVFFFSACLLTAETQAWLSTGDWTTVLVRDAWQCLGFTATSAHLLDQPLSIASLCVALAVAAAPAAIHLAGRATRAKTSAFGTRAAAAAA